MDESGVVKSDGDAHQSPSPIVSAGSDVAAYAVSIQPPQFSEADASGWFAIMNAQFVLWKITCESTKFYHILAALPASTVSRIPAQVLLEKNFESLKDTVLGFHEQSKSEIFDKIISKTIMTSKPSLFLEEILKHANKVGVGRDLVRHKFIQSLPPPIAPAIASQCKLDLLELGKLADELLPLARAQSGYAVNVVAADTGTRDNAPTQGVSTSTTLPPGLHPFHANQRPCVCRAHLYYGNRARSCKPWCKWPSKPSDLSLQPSSQAPSPAPCRSSGQQEN